MFLAFTKFHYGFFFCLGPFLYLISWTREGWENCPVAVVAAKRAKTADLWTRKG